MRINRDSINYDAISIRARVARINNNIISSSTRNIIITTTTTTLTITTKTVASIIITSIRIRPQRTICTFYRLIGSHPVLGMPRLMGRHRMDDQGWGLAAGLEALALCPRL